MKRVIKVFTDGGARGNPGEAAYGFVVYDEGSNILFKEGKKIGISTNNVAEYKGVINALIWISEKFNGEEIDLQFFLDSNLIRSQLSGLFKIKNENLRDLYFTAKTYEDKIRGNISYSYIPREKNKEADLLVNLALDHKI